MRVSTFEYKNNDLSSPEKFLQTLERLVEQAKTLNPFELLDSTKFYNAATNAYGFEEDEWFDLVYEPGNFNQLSTFMDKVNELQQQVASKVGNKNFTPLIIQYAAENNPQINDLLKTKGIDASMKPMNPVENTVTALHAHP